ncbi:hypothetical protein B0H17DRAFT_1049956 [Mycena rosella]|uniref:Uncharacterized protein n=1 Tax=Mycena rosella TaxID=1033263 RepID=A0AAD7DVN8_MYCRO|nr:hypothetical protein B0H17DRAFT_1049956 [Mycena rosella]
MGSDSQPLLVDAPPSTDVDNGQLQHYCACCSSQLESHQDNKESQPWTMRHSLIIVAIILSSVIFIFSVVEMSTARIFRGPSILQIFVVIWTDMTITYLALLLYMGRRRQAGRRKLGRTVAQVRVMCALASSWTSTQIRSHRQLSFILSSLHDHNDGTEPKSMWLVLQ